MSVLGDRIKQLRKERNMTQTDLSNMLNTKYGMNTDRVMVSKWETGFQRPTISTLSCIKDLFGVTLDYLNGENNAVPISENNLTEIETAVLELFRQIPKERQAEALELLRIALKMQQKH